jgi:hypothetical protein
VDIRRQSATITRPSNTTPYTAGDLVANSATAGSVTPLSYDFGSAQPLWLRSIKISKDQASVTNASFRVWLLSASPTVTNGDNGAIAGSFLSTVLSEPIVVDVSVLLTSGGAVGQSFFDPGLIRIPGGTIYALVEANGAYTPASGEIFTIEISAQVAQ